MKILLLSDETMCVNAGGLSQTLYNIFSFIDKENILCVTQKKSVIKFPPSKPYTDRYITYNFEIIKVPRNRLAIYFDPLADRFNFTYNKYRNFSRIIKQIDRFKADIVVSCSNGPIGLFMHQKLLSGLTIKKVFPYFMDDWMYQRRSNWLDKQINDSAKTILSENDSWLIISKELAEILQNRYNAHPRRILEIHNPVNLSDAPDVLPVKKKLSYNIAYAGSLWDMHFDAFCVMAKAVKQVSNINFLLYTSQQHWKWRKAELEPLGVIYGGNIPYKDIHQKLGAADALVLSSSFSKEYYTHSKGSVQTKITDYLKSRRLIISCGPEYSANHHFLKRYNCGICIETNDYLLVASRLTEIFNNIELYEPLVTSGWNLLKTEFTFSKVHNKLKHFLSLT